MVGQYKEGLKELKSMSASLLIDGIQLREHSESPRLVVNLSEDLQPELSIDRSRVISWEIGQAWLTTVLREHGWRSLTKWPDVSFASLAALIHFYPSLVLTLDRELRTHQFKPQAILFTRDKAQTLSPIGVGISELDQEVACILEKHENFIPAYGLSMRYLLLRARLQVLSEAGLKLSQPFAQLVALDRGHPLPNPRLGTVQLLSRDLDGQGPWLDTLPLSHLLRAAETWGIPLREVIELARPLAALGLSLPSQESLASVGEFSPSPRHRQLLSQDLDSEEPWLDTLPLSHLLRVAETWGIPLQEVIELAHPLVVGGLTANSSYLDPWELAVYSDRTGESIGSLTEAIEQLNSVTTGVEQCLSFAHFCAQQK